MSKHDPATCNDPVNCPTCSTLAIDILPIPADRSKPHVLPGFTVAVNVYTGSVTGWQTTFVRANLN